LLVELFCTTPLMDWAVAATEQTNSKSEMAACFNGLGSLVEDQLKD
jgi:hypothetical protein